MAKTVSVRVEFDYMYLGSADTEDVLYNCPYGSREKFLETFEMQDLGVSSRNRHCRIAQRIFEIPIEGKLPPASIDEKDVGCGGIDLHLFDTKFNPVRLKESRAYSTALYYFLWIDKRTEWVSIVKDASYTWELGRFNERMIGPFSGAHLENRINRVFEDEKKIRRDAKFSFSNTNPVSAAWLYDKMKHRHEEMNCESSIILAGSNNKWDIKTDDAQKLIDFCKPGNYTISLTGTASDLNDYCTLLKECEKYSEFIEWAKNTRRSI